jgi:hypothetical protein
MSEAADWIEKLEVNGKRPGSFKELASAVTDPSLKIVEVNPHVSLNLLMIHVVFLGLRFLALHRVPPARAKELAGSFGHSGKYAFHLSDYERNLRMAYGKAVDHFDEDRFMHEMQRGKRALAFAGYKVEEINANFENQVLFLRAVLRVAEWYDITPKDADTTMSIFGKSGACALAMESYSERHLTRREMTRK